MNASSAQWLLAHLKDPFRCSLPKLLPWSPELNSHAKLSRFTFLPLIAVALSLVLTGCAREFPNERVPNMKLLLLDFDVPPGMKETPTEIRGWWFGARTVFQNPRAGQVVAERVSLRLAKLPFINLFSRTDLKYYFARKQQLLKDNYDHLSPSELDRLMNEVPDIEFARELGADKLLTGRIISSATKENRTVHFWISTVHLEVVLTDVMTGDIEWRRTYKDTDFAASDFSVQDEIATEIADDLKWEYFYPLAQGETPQVSR